MNDRVGQQTGDRGQLDEAYRIIRGAILRCELAPGEHVAELALASRFGYGRAAVRSALTRLAHEQLVTPVPRQGYEVAPVTLDSVRDLYETRLAVEPAVARLAAARSPESLIPELEALNRACHFSNDERDLIGVREANKLFHAAIGRGGGNLRLAALSTALMDELDRVLYMPQIVPLWDRLRSTYDEHTRIIEAIARRDERAAEQAARKHVRVNQDSAVAALLASANLQSINLMTR